MTHDSRPPAAGYVRVSTRIQAAGYSPAEQRDRIVRLAEQEGYDLSMIEEDHESGGNVSRQGYQNIIAAVREGRIHAVFVYMFDRWGRDGAEWLARAREFERLGVRIWSVQEGKDEGGLMRFMRAGMAEEESRKIASRAAPGRARAAENGTHVAPTPFGYMRVYPERVGNLKQRAGILVPDPETAWVVQEVYTRYEQGDTSIRQLAEWMNADPRVPKPKRAPLWTTTSIFEMLRRPTYRGALEFNKEPQGKFVFCSPADYWIKEDQHEAIITPEQWQSVERIRNATRIRRSANRRSSKSGNPTAMLVGLLFCNECGCPMYADLFPTKRQYFCSGRRRGRGCRGHSVKFQMADEAVLSILRRLVYVPWTNEMEKRLINGHVDEAGELLRQLEAEKAALNRHTLLMSYIDSPTPEQIEAFRTSSATISERIRSLQDQLGDDRERVEMVPRLRQAHKQFENVTLKDMCDLIKTPEQKAGVRPLLFRIIKKARIIERTGERYADSVKAKIEWAPEIQAFLDEGLMVLSD